MATPQDSEFRLIPSRSCEGEREGREEGRHLPHHARKFREERPDYARELMEDPAGR